MSGGKTSWLAARRAERAWLDAVGLFEQGATDRAAARFADAVRDDPTAADAWLGLHATGQRQDEALAAMEQHVAKFGALRAKHNKSLVSQFRIGTYANHALETSGELWLAVHSALLDAGALGEAWQTMAEAEPDCDGTRFLTTRYAYLSEEWNWVLSSSTDIEDPLLVAEAQLYAAQALIAQKVWHEALNTLTWLSEEMEVNSDFEAEVAYWSGVAHEGLGAGEQALKHFQYAYRHHPGLYDVAERAQVVQAGAGAAAVVAGQRADLLAEARAELDGMIGLDSVKRQVHTLIAQLEMAELRAQQGIPTRTRPQHFVFAGPPGTGKTTVARIVGKVFAGLGLLERGHVVETQRVDLVGEHLGSTALKTSAVIDSALDGVLFIDEAYALVNEGYNGGDAFGNEALQVLLKRAEDDRERLVVVLAGYRREMETLLATNPGLASRFTTHVDFPSYAPEELRRIAVVLLDDNGDVLSPAGANALEQSLKGAADRIDALGNGRFIRNLCQKAAAHRDLRLAATPRNGEPLTREDLVTLHAPDILAAFDELMERAKASTDAGGPSPAGA
ncbi:AAA family ATPase [Streptomyces sp. VNUA116]|uniref:AAA family ATPase n=1 Tax=Streptomyces sp. VNUA116 TaxID=3062449 RepID=UPI002675F97E|nr:AAA family ATPase [Streptomyces sp. VNUA116]WKU48895.1 AAA family ATPase [Streptomyces sp. VNUA116]